MSEPWGVSIMVVNYNNEPFLAAAIDSALSQTHPHCEVIIVDDCSTDNSRATIARYRDRVRVMLREENGGQVIAQESAWPLARYPILIFLDSDDLLFPHAAAKIADIWTPATVKAQFPLATIDHLGRQLGHVAPKYPPNIDAMTIRADLLRAGGSPNSPGSGNAYSRSLLARVRADGGFDLENPREFAMDALLECNAPFYGEVVTIHEPLSCYRIHQSNMFAIADVKHAQFAIKWRREESKIEYMAQRCRYWGIHFDSAAARKASVMMHEYQIFAAKLERDSVRQPILTTLCSAVKAYIGTPMPYAYRIIRILWLITVTAAPRGLAARVLALRFVPGLRPAWLSRLLIYCRKLGTTRKSEPFTAVS